MIDFPSLLKQYDKCMDIGLYIVAEQQKKYYDYYFRFKCISWNYNFTLPCFYQYLEFSVV